MKPADDGKRIMWGFVLGEIKANSVLHECSALALEPPRNAKSDDFTEIRNRAARFGI